MKDVRYVKNRVPLWRVEDTIRAANTRAAFEQQKLDEATYADADQYRFKEFDYMPPESMIGRDHNMGFEPYEFEWPEEGEKYFKGLVTYRLFNKIESFYLLNPMQLGILKNSYFKK